MSSVRDLWFSLTGDLGWVDLGALVVVSLFFLLGLLRGLAWQVGRAMTVLGAVVASMAFGPPAAGQLFHGVEPSPAHLYAGYLLVFLVGFILLSGCARLLHGAVKRAGLSFYDRIGGGVLGLATGGLVVLAAVTLVLMFGERFPIYAEVQASHAVNMSRSTVRLLGDVVPDPVQEVFAPPPATAPEAAAPREAHTPELDRVLRDLGRGR